jgi:para-aminobenzoate synthetase/4-amino-4-deoxychorismate lyase
VTGPFAVLEFPGLAAHEFSKPRRVVQATTVAEVGAVLDAVDDEVALGGSAIGFVSYEAAPGFDPAIRVRPAGELPLAWFAIFDSGLPRSGGPVQETSASWNERVPRTQYDDAVGAIRDAIGRGDVYQVNYTVPLDVEVSGNTSALFGRLVMAQGPGYAARIHTGRFELLSASPELFFDRRQRHIITRPMKGTARRGRWLEEDDARAAALAASAKERAENVMIVDLLRNDLGRVSEVGSVRATRLFDVERRPTVLQMTSTVEATLRPDVSTRMIFEALFPCGSVTGAPKIAATGMIADVEVAPRGAYCGAIGYVAREVATFSVAIRTLTVDHGTGTAVYGVGSGITWDSAQAAEYDELIAKAGILTADLPAFELLETLRLEDGRYARLDRHLARLESSAKYFGFPHALMRDEAGRALDAHAAAAGARAHQRVRVRVGPSGMATVDAAPLPESLGIVPVALATTAVKRANRFLFHKTTHRAVYERHRAEAPGAFDVLLWNEDGELTEFTIGNVVVEIDGQRWTPPRECGLLAGVFRQELIESGLIAERVIRREDLPRSRRMWLINSVREWVEAELQ